ncbi:MAG TPA: sulfotransferase [Planctomycetaceae bacterium]|nr:sulfotransferase [Planctomycetaceae bacterium]
MTQTGSLLATGTKPNRPPEGVHQSKQNLTCVWQGLNRRRWKEIARDLPRDAKYWPRRASIAAISTMNSFYEACEHQLYGARIARTTVEHPPIFVLGHWRSGTTLMHNLLTLDPQLTYPNLYQVMFSGHFLLTETMGAALTGWMLPKTRPMDNVPAGWKHSQEDEIALLLRTGLSPYAMLVHQGKREHYHRFFDLTELTAEERDRWVQEFQWFMKKLTLRSNKPIVLKSPTHTYRVPLLLELYPNARFIYITRNPYDVYNSTIHLRKTLFTENALSEPCFENLEEDTFVTYDHCIRRYEETKSLIPPGQLHELRFEDLETDPLGEMHRVYQALKLPGWDAMIPRLRAQMPEHTAYQKNRFQPDIETMQRVYDRWRYAFECYGYPHQLSGASERVA